ncbi:TOMM precursor leader peptide-binding protein [Streptosporangium sp. NPDC002721]|uniref:TOMM precursor leader peptide-binding protein n=1 Tax=Streptosporangium sp. NPDC002721 TaxID=3366188 RepID=UPI00369F6505
MATQEPLSGRELRIAHLGPDEAVVKRGLTEVRLAAPGVGALLTRIVELADGSRSLDELVDAFPPQEREEAREVAVTLHARGLLGEDAGDDPVARFWASMARLSPDGPGEIAKSSVFVTGTGQVADALARSLVACGVGRVGTRPTPAAGDDGWDLWCAAADGPADPALVDVARRALDTRAVLLPVWIDDLVIRVGPLTHPFDTACLRCYLLRIDSGDVWREAHAMLRGQRSPGAGFLPSIPSVAGEIAATEAVKHLTGLPVTACGRVIEVSLVPFRAAVRRVLRVPRCPDCGGTARQSAPVITHGSQLSE